MCVIAENQWFPPGTPVASINKIDRHDIIEILLKVVLNTITITLSPTNLLGNFFKLTTLVIA
jgi:hypothetical protein